MTDSCVSAEKHASESCRMGKMCRRILSAISLNPLHNGKQSPQRNLRDVEHPVGRMLTLWKISARLGRSLALPFGRRTMVCRLHSLVRGKSRPGGSIGGCMLRKEKELRTARLRPLDDFTGFANFDQFSIEDILSPES